MHKATRLAALLLVAFAGLLFVLAVWLGVRGHAQPASVPALQPAAVRASAAAQPVVVAARDLPAGKTLDNADLRLATMASVPFGASADPGLLSGRVLAVAVAADTVLRDSQLAHGLALDLQPGERALAVPVDELAGAGNRIAPGDYVDVFMSLKPRSPDQDDGQSRLLLSRLRVLSYGAQDLGRPAQAPAADNTAPAGNARAESIAAREGGNTSPATQPARSAVLAVPVEQANRLLLAAQGGKLFLALRHPADTGSPDEALFPRPRTVLMPRVGLEPALRDAAGSPENNAFAGIDAGALAGRRATPMIANEAPAGPSGMRRRAAAPPLEIIRGAQASTLSPQ